MSWFGTEKKEDNLNSLKLPELPELPERKFLPELPALPSTYMANQLNNELVKSAVIDSSGETRGDEFEVRRDFSSMPAMQPVQFSSVAMPTMPKQRQNEMVFVKIDKFQEAQKDFNEIKKKVKEIELLLKEVATISQKEEAQVGEWSKDLDRVKMLLVDIDTKVFNQI